MSTYEELGQQHRQVVSLVARLQSLQGKDDQARMLLRCHLEALHGRLVDHFAAEERGGYFVDIREAHPELDRRVAGLGAQHALLLAELQAVRAEAVQEPLSDVKARMDRLLDHLLAHERTESSLIQEAAMQDIGVAD